MVGKLAELDMVTMDLERANGRIIQLEKKVDDLKEENTKLQETRDDMEGYSHYSSYKNFPLIYFVCVILIERH